MTRYRDYRIPVNPRGVHVDVLSDQDLDEVPEYHAPSPRRNRYSRPNQTPRFRSGHRDVSWISPQQHSAGRTPQTPHTSTQRMPSPEAPPSPQPINLPTPVIGRREASPAPTEHEIAEHMTADNVIYGQYEGVDPYRPQRRGSGSRLMKGFWKRLQKLSGFNAQGPGLTRMGPVRLCLTPDLPLTSAYTSPSVRPASVNMTSDAIPPALRAATPVRSPAMPSPITVSPSFVPSPPPITLSPSLVPPPPPITLSPSLVPPPPPPGSVTTPSVAASPAMAGQQNPRPEADQAAQGNGSQTLHDHVRPRSSSIQD
ncbi:hypothetical protein BU15DRAFT_71749 [Melanogaster broomeanus]|nr:hypothetical protein BU15DRAFT_71749 [Melanogaster broomeanus]